MSRIWVKLDATYVEDDAIVAVGPLAELLYIRALTYCRRRVSDGRIPAAVVPVIAAQIPAEPSVLVAALVREELWLEVDGGYQVRSWSEWQVTSESLKSEAERKKLAREEKRTEKNRRQSVDVQRTDGGRPADTNYEMGRLVLASLPRSNGRAAR